MKPSTPPTTVVPTAMAAFPFRLHSVTSSFLLFLGCCNYFSTTTLAEGWLSLAWQECFTVGLAWHIFTVLMCLFKNIPWLLPSFSFWPFVVLYRRILGPTVSSPLRKYPKIMEGVALLGFSFFWVLLLSPGPEYWGFCRTFLCDLAYSCHESSRMLGWGCVLAFVGLAKTKVAEPRTTAEASTISKKLKDSATILFAGGLFMRLVMAGSARVTFFMRPEADPMWVGGMILRVVSL